MEKRTLSLCHSVTCHSVTLSPVRVTPVGVTKDLRQDTTLDSPRGPNIIMGACVTEVDPRKSEGSSRRWHEEAVNAGGSKAPGGCRDAAFDLSPVRCISDF